MKGTTSLNFTLVPWGKIKRGEELLNRGYALNKKIDKAGKAYEGKKVPEEVLKARVVLIFKKETQASSRIIDPSPYLTACTKYSRVFYKKE